MVCIVKVHLCVSVCVESFHVGYLDSLQLWKLLLRLPQQSPPPQVAGRRVVQMQCQGELSSHNLILLSVRFTSERSSTKSLVRPTWHAARNRMPLIGFSRSQLVVPLYHNSLDTTAGHYNVGNIHSSGATH